MKKLSCVVPKERTDKLIRELQRLACVEITAPKDELLSLKDDTERERTLLSQRQSIQQAIEFLMVYDENKYSLFSPPPEASMDDFDSGLDSIVLNIADNAAKLSHRITSLKAKIAESEALISALEPWYNYDIALPLQKTSSTVFLGGTLPQNADLAAIRTAAADAPAYLELVDRPEKGAITVLFCAHHSYFEEGLRLLSSFGFSKVAVCADEESGFAREKLRKQKDRLSYLKEKLKNAKKEAISLARELPGLKAMYDVLSSRLLQSRARASTCDTKKTTFLWGWVPEDNIEEVVAILNKRGAAYSFDDPKEDDEVPIKLKNNRYSRNFEPILSMYALPLYGRFDPTFLMSVFYTVIFGLMFADVGYGVLLLAGCIAGLKLLHPKEGLRYMLTMFALCSVACIIGGILFGGYFGDLPNAIAEGFGGAENTASTALWFDMIEDPIAFLVVALAVGAVHLICGMAVKFYILCKDHMVLDAVFDIGSWFVLFLGIGLYFLSSTVGLIFALIGVAMLVLTQGRHEKNIIMKLATGVMSLYDIVSYASDLLSYSRILALSLASAVIASVVNLLGTMGGASFGGILMFILVFLLGHTINFAVNILGTYVHTSRLQYIEFFGKFFESGGKEFSPLATESKYVKLK